MAQEISWATAFWFLPPLAINSMMQPSGRVCGFDLSLRTYLRSSPIVCVFDAVTIILRFVVYCCLGASPPVAAKRTIDARRRSDDATELGGIRALEQLPFLRWVWFVIGVLPQVIKLLACSGLPWTQVWGCFYLAPFVAVEAMNALTVLAPEGQDSTEDDPREHWVALAEKVCGAVAVLLQLALLAWIDLAVMPPDSNLVRVWAFRLFRLSAHFVVFLIYLPLMGLQSDAPTLSPNRRLGVLVVSMLSMYVLLAGLERFRFSQLYFMLSIIISFFVWLLYFIPVAKTHVLLCEPGSRGYMNVLAFDFLCRTLCFSLFWYAVHYNPAGTSKSDWAAVLGRSVSN
jgi:hypothetical protein